MPVARLRCCYTALSEPVVSCPITRPAVCCLLPQVKNGISHRYRSLDKLRAYLLDRHTAAAAVAADGGEAAP